MVETISENDEKIFKEKVNKLISEGYKISSTNCGYVGEVGGDLYCCEGVYCKEAYERYLDYKETTENIVKYASNVKLVNKEELNGSTA